MRLSAKPVLVEKPVVGAPDFAGAEYAGPQFALKPQDLFVLLALLVRQTKSAT